MCENMRLKKSIQLLKCGTAIALFAVMLPYGATVSPEGQVTLGVVAAYADEQDGNGRGGGRGNGRGGNNGLGNGGEEGQGEDDDRGSDPSNPGRGNGGGGGGGGGDGGGGEGGGGGGGGTGGG
ncbi:MAG: hypothetical protein OEN23_07175, partial [Paracoccaceae bacterium]|nr:hypothetical protein [Paracoccaceae bacterium]